ncbi:type II toxin-antitoxin system RelE/ParE family toxin [Endozoicomonas sp. 2B-B]
MRLGKSRVETTSGQFCGRALYTFSSGVGVSFLYETGKPSGIQTMHARRVKAQLQAIDTANVIDDIDLPGYGLHPLVGDSKGVWSITVKKNWRITFEFTDGNAYILNYEDYH